MLRNNENIRQKVAIPTPSRDVPRSIYSAAELPLTWSAALSEVRRECRVRNPDANAKDYQKPIEVPGLSNLVPVEVIETKSAQEFHELPVSPPPNLGKTSPRAP